MTAPLIHVPVGFAQAVLAAQPSDVEFLGKKSVVHSAERLAGVTRTGYRPVRIRGELVPEAIRVVYVHEERQGCSEWYVINWVQLFSSDVEV